MITHQVWFTLRHAAGSAAEADFLRRSRETLAAIPGVADFSVLRQISGKAPWRFGFSMVFADQAAYDAYNGHPDHLAYVEQVWMAEVADFQEVDSVAL